MDPQQEASLWSQISHGALGTLGYVGQSLDKALGGRALRGLLGGRPEELLSVIPFSDAMGITDERNIVSGQQLIGGNDSDGFFSPSGIGGLAAEIALDPGTYLTFGGSALSRAGQAAKKAGVLPKTTARRMAGFAQGSPELNAMSQASGLPATSFANAPLGGHAGVGLPFGMSDQAVFDLSGPASALGNAASTAIGALPGGQAALSVGRGVANLAKDFKTRTLNPVFDPSVKGATSELGQTLGRRISEQEARTTASALEQFIPTLQAGHAQGFLDDVPGRELRSMLENELPTSSQAANVVSELRQQLQDVQQQRLGLGLPAELLTDQEILTGPAAGKKLGYTPRQMTFKEPKSIREWWETERIRPEDDFARKRRYRGLTTSQINDMAQAVPPTTNPNDVAEWIGQNYLGLPQNPGQHLQQLKQAGAPADQIEKIQNLIEQAGELAHLKIRNKLPEFLNSPFRDHLEKIVSDNQAILHAKEIWDTLAEHATPIVNATDEAMPLSQVLEGAGFNTHVSNYQVLLANLGASMAKYGKQPQTLSALGIPTELANDIIKMRRASSVEGLEQVRKIYDSMTNWTKTFQTVLWPANHARNQLQALFQHVVHDVADPRFSKMDPKAKAWVTPWLDAKAWQAGKEIPGANEIPMFRGMSNQDASAALQKLIIQWDVPRHAGKAGEEVFGKVAGIADQDLTRLLPGMPQKGPVSSVVDPIREASGKDWKQVAGVQGAFGYDKDVFPLAKAGRSLASSLDDLNRVAAFIAKMRQGFSPEMALREVNKAHFDFSKLTSTERTYFRRLIPFYSWMKQNIPSVLQQIAEKPGGVMAQSVRATNSARGENPGFIPDYLKDKTAIRVGSPRPGTSRFLSQLGLGYEDLGELSGQGFLGSLNPLIKAPLELATGRQLFSGRDLRDLYSDTEALTGQRVGWLDQMMANSPFGRAAALARTANDPRKTWGDVGINFGTGFRLTDVEDQQAQRIALRNYAEELLRGQPGVDRFERLFVKPENLANLSPDEQALYGLYSQLQNRRR